MAVYGAFRQAQGPQEMAARLSRVSSTSTTGGGFWSTLLRSLSGARSKGDFGTSQELAIYDISVN